MNRTSPQGGGIGVEFRIERHPAHAPYPLDKRGRDFVGFEFLNRLFLVVINTAKRGGGDVFFFLFVRLESIRDAEACHMGSHAQGVANELPEFRLSVELLEGARLVISPSWKGRPLSSD